jgi:hypothetical protein
LEELLTMKRQHGVGLTLIIAELDFVDVGGKGFDDRAHLSSKEVVLGEVFLEGDDVEEVELGAIVVLMGLSPDVSLLD